MLKAHVDRWSEQCVLGADMGMEMAAQHGESDGIASRIIDQDKEAESLSLAVAGDEGMGSGGDFGEKQAEDVAFPGLVRELVELGEEGCFRLVVTFL